MQQEPDSSVEYFLQLQAEESIKANAKKSWLWHLRNYFFIALLTVPGIGLSILASNPEINLNMHDIVNASAGLFLFGLWLGIVLHQQDNKSNFGKLIQTLSGAAVAACICMLLGLFNAQAILVATVAGLLLGCTGQYWALFLLNGF